MHKIPKTLGTHTRINMEKKELQLHLALSTPSTQQDQDRKRTFHDAFSDVSSCKRTLPLFVWADHDTADTPQEKRTHKCLNSNSSRYGDVEEDIVVGWPPVKSWMRKLSKQNRRECSAANYTTAENGGGTNSMYVKVEMEGFGIARKVDLSLHRSYQSLTATQTLLPMFAKCPENFHMYKLTYQDKEGDWLLAGDVPWGNFVESVRRLKLVKDDES